MILHMIDVDAFWCLQPAAPISPAALPAPALPASTQVRKALHPSPALHLHYELTTLLS